MITLPSIFVLVPVECFTMSSWLRSAQIIHLAAERQAAAPPEEPSIPFDPMTLQTLQRVALLRMHESHVKRAVIARLMEDAQDTPSMTDYVALRLLGLCEYQRGKRLHDLTPMGRVAASTLEKRLCQTLGIHVKLGGNDNLKGSTRFYCSCGQWSIYRARNQHANASSTWAFLAHCDTARVANEALQRMPKEESA